MSETSPSDRWLLPVIAVLVAAAIGGASGVAGSYFGAAAVVQSSRDQISATRDQAVRDKRATIYASYLGAAHTFLSADLAASDYFAKQPRPLHVPATAGPLKDIFTARVAYQRAVNDLYVFGSNTAWDAHLAIAALLPTSLGGTDPTVQPIDVVAFQAVYRDFQQVFCREVPAVPRSRC